MTCETTDMTRGTETTDNPWQREEKEANAFLVSMSGFPLSDIRLHSDPSTPDKVLRSGCQTKNAQDGKARELRTREADASAIVRHDKGFRR